MKFGFYTLGCKVNQYETQAMEQILREKGHTVGDFTEDCDVYIVNTCSVTAVADNLQAAVNKAYDAADRIHFENSFCRRDIGARALKALN